MLGIFRICLTLWIWRNINFPIIFLIIFQGLKYDILPSFAGFLNLMKLSNHITVPVLLCQPETQETNFVLSLFVLYAKNSPWKTWLHLSHFHSPCHS